MIRVLFISLLLEVCFAALPANEVETSRFKSRIHTIMYTDPPWIPDYSTIKYLFNVTVTSEKSVISYYSNVTFYDVDNFYIWRVHSIKHAVDVDNFQVRTTVTTGKMRILGSYSSTVPHSSTNNNQDFQLTLDQIILSYDFAFQLENGTVKFGKTVDKDPIISGVTGELPDGLRINQPSKLLDAFKDKLYEEVHRNRNLTDESLQITRFILREYGTTIAQRLNETIFNIIASDDFRSNIFNVYYPDVSDFRMEVEGNNVSMPFFAIRPKIEVGQSKYDLYNHGITFADDGVYLTFSLHLKLRLVARMNYGPTHLFLSGPRTLEVEFREPDTYPITFFAFARYLFQETIVEIESEPNFITFFNFPSPRLKLPIHQDHQPILKLANFIRETRYLPTNLEYIFKKYMRRIFADGQLAKEIFKTIDAQILEALWKALT